MSTGLIIGLCLEITSSNRLIVIESITTIHAWVLLESHAVSEPQIHFKVSLNIWLSLSVFSYLTQYF